jgi:hypothetical protein
MDGSCGQMRHEVGAGHGFLAVFCLEREEKGGT